MHDAVVAQLVEHLHGKEKVTGSIPVNGSEIKEPPLRGGFLLKGGGAISLIADFSDSRNNHKLSHREDQTRTHRAFEVRLLDNVVPAKRIF